MKEKINILQLITGLNTGGAERVVFDISYNLSKVDFNVFVGSLLEGGNMRDLFISRGMHTFNCNIDKSIKGLLSAIKQINQFVNENNISIIHAHMFHAALVGCIVKIVNPKIEIVFTPHSINLQSKIREFVIFILKKYRSHDIVFSNIEDIRFYHKAIKIIPNGVRIQKKSIAKKFSVFTFICVGGFRPAKNYINFIESLKDYSFPVEYQILLVGTGELEEEVSHAIKENGLEDKIILLGLRRDVNDLLKKSHVFLMPSLWEGMPISILEAGAAGLPVLATPVGNIPKLITSKTGYLRNWDQFPEAMIDIYQNYEEAKIKGENLREKIKLGFSIESVVIKHEELYKEIMNYA